MATIRIQTQGYNYYDVDSETGYIKRLDQPDLVPSSGWVMRGIRHVKATSDFIPLKDCVRFIADKLKTADVSSAFRYKNGKGQWSMCDIDHGTYREWGDRIIAMYVLSK